MEFTALAHRPGLAWVPKGFEGGVGLARSQNIKFCPFVTHIGPLCPVPLCKESRPHRRLQVAAMIRQTLNG
jgi:hypothetical protein